MLVNAGEFWKLQFDKELFYPYPSLPLPYSAKNANIIFKIRFTYLANVKLHSPQTVVVFFLSGGVNLQREFREIVNIL